MAARFTRRRAEEREIAPDSPAIDMRALRREFGETLAVDDVSGTVPRGALFGLVGPDGAGKSTLIRMLATVIAPSAGDALIFGRSVVSEPQAVKPRIGYMSQRFSLYGDLSVRENLEFFGELRGVPRRERGERGMRLLELMGMAEFSGRPAQYLSGGMKQKLALAVTLLHEPDLLFLDEPTTGVDPVSRREFWRIISQLHRRGITVLVATPYMDEAERCTEIAFMAEGRFILRDTPAGMKRRVPGRLYEVAANDPRAALALLCALPGVIRADLLGDVVHVVVPPEDGWDVRLADAVTARGLAVQHVRQAAVSMETAFASLLEQGGEVCPLPLGESGEARR